MTITLEDYHRAIPELRQRGGKYHAPCPACGHREFAVFPRGTEWACKCFRASCPGAYAAIREALAGNPPPRPVTPAGPVEKRVWRGPSRGVVVAEYQYPDATKLRIEPGREGRRKDFVWIHGSAPWMGRPSSERWLYRWDRLCAKPDARVLLVEGEKCVQFVEPLLPAGWVACCPSDGSSSDPKRYLAQLEGRVVLLLSDHDAPGATMAAKWSRAFTGVARSFVAMDLHERQGVALEEGEDVVEWVQRGGRLASVLR